MIKDVDVGRKVGERVGEKVGENEAKIFDLISQDNNVTYIELANKIDITEKSVYVNIEKLKQKGLLKRVGPAKGGHWEII
jgi:ATP-dependent DNA helicase RecG